MRSYDANPFHVNGTYYADLFDAERQQLRADAWRAAQARCRAAIAARVTTQDQAQEAA